MLQNGKILRGILHDYRHLYHFKISGIIEIMLKLCVFIPATHLDTVKTAMFAAGAGKIGHYDSCSWQTLGQGQFRPLDNSQPFIGRTGHVETVDEYKVELIVEDEHIKSVVAAMKLAHPYEEPAYDVTELADY